MNCKVCRLILEELQEESINLKQKLGQLLQAKKQPMYMAKIEAFHTGLINEDENVHALLKEVQYIERVMQMQSTVLEADVDEIRYCVNIVRSRIEDEKERIEKFNREMEWLQQMVE